MDNEFIFGEQFVADAPAFAALMMAEANRMWASEGWKPERRRGGVFVESKPVDGPFKGTGILVMRSAGLVRAEPQVIFDFLVSPEGYAVLDPVSNPQDHKHPPLEVYDWLPGSRLEAALATAKTPFSPPCEFVVLNAIHPCERIFVSKSILHPKRPGASKFYRVDADHPAAGVAAVNRALNTMAIRCDSAPGGTNLLCLNYVDMGLWNMPWLYNFINRNFFAMLYKRLKMRLKSREALYQTLT